MKDKFNRAKATIQKHRTKIAFSSGVLVGAGALITVVATRTPPEIWLAASPESLQRLLADDIGAVTWTHTSGAVINVFNEAHPMFQ
jgi:hypothetical protein